MNIEKQADIVLSSQAVFTGLEDEPRPAAIAITDNKIIAIGSEEEIEPFIGEQTKVYKYDDELIMPGFHDFHLHVMMGSLSLESVNLFAARSEEEAVNMVQEYGQAHPEEPWIIGFMWDSSYWDDQELPHRSSLDRVFPDRPVLLFHAEGHYAWVNSKALEIAGIDRDTENPPYGTIEKDEMGEPTGIVIERAIEPITRYAFDLSQARKTELFQGFLAEAARFGVTSVNDLFGTQMNSRLDDFPLLQKFEEQGKLTVRIHLFPVLDGDLKRAEQLRKTYASDKLRVSGLKQFIDGVITSRTAYLLGSYADMPGVEGHAEFSLDTLTEWVVEADKAGFSVRFHAIGEGAIRMALDTFEEARKQNGVRDSRHSVEHVEVIHPTDIPRFKQLGVIASMQPDHFALSERNVYTERIGMEREKYVFAIRTLKDAGAKLAFGTDFPIDSLNPMRQLYRAITRVDSGGVDVWNPAERITLAEAIRAYTSGSAFGTFREHELGTLEVGKLADIAVLDRNLFDVSAEEILDAQANLTIVDGSVVFEKKTGALKA